MIRDNATSPTIKGESIPPTLIIVLFDFDRGSLRADTLPMLKANVRTLKDTSGMRVFPESRGDERGPAAYIVISGERRARTMKSYMQQLELSIDFRTTSDGKDHLYCCEHTNECRQMN